MEITINNQSKLLEATEQLTVQQLLDLEIPLRQKGIAIAINQKVIPKAEWNDAIVSHKDSIIIIKATQGG